MSIFDDLPSAPDGRPYWLDKRFASLFTWGRPPLPGQAADLLAALTDKYKIRKALVLGSCCPSVLAAIGFGDPERVIRMIDLQSRWWEAYGWFLEDMDDPESYPRYDAWLPSKRIFAMGEWQWSPRLGEMLFVDLPGSSPLVRADLLEVLTAVSPRLVVLGFMSGQPGPDDLGDALLAHGWSLAESTIEAKNCESGERLSYRLMVAENPEPLVEDHDAQERLKARRLKMKDLVLLWRKLTDSSSQPVTDEWLSDIERLRECYKPDTVRVLFVGESPPAGGTFFYLGNSNLYHHTATALGLDECAKESLHTFQEAGGYLIDLCPDPLDGLERPARREKRRQAEVGLSERLKAFTPEAIVIVMKGIEDNVRRAIKAAGLSETLPVFVVSFPANGRQSDYIRELREVADRLKFIRDRDRSG